MADIRFQALGRHAKDGDIAGVLRELKRGTDVDARRDETHNTPLMNAVASPKAGVGLVGLLIQKGADVNARVIEKGGALMEKGIKGIESLIEGNVGTGLRGDRLQEMKKVLREMRALAPVGEEKIHVKRNVLSIAVKGGDLEKVQMLVEAGADVRYEFPHGYDVLIHAVYGSEEGGENEHEGAGVTLVPILQLLIQHGAKLNGVTDYGESALSVASLKGRFDAVRVLLDAGADAGLLQWTPLMERIVFGTVEEVRKELESGPDLAARDSAHRTAWLLSLQVGEVEKAKALLAGGADRNDRGQGEKPALVFAIINGKAEMLRWLLAEGFSADAGDDFGKTALMEAAERGALESVRILIEAGADIHRATLVDERAIQLAGTREIATLLIQHGADINETGEEMRRMLAELPKGGRIHLAGEDYLIGKHRRFGKANPDKMNIAFWKAMVVSGIAAHAARRIFADVKSYDEPVWCFKRFGKSINLLSDGRVIEVGGEHEDHYDPDFCIYNEVIVHFGGGEFQIFGYPEALFPPTDFHSATLVGSHIYIIGNLGNSGRRDYGQTPVYRLNIENYQMEKVETKGQMPGWIFRHKAEVVDGARIKVWGGKECVMEGGKEVFKDHEGEFVLELGTGEWRRK